MIASVTPIHAGAKQDLLNARFLTAAAACHVPAVKVLLGDGANINIRGEHNETALSQACREGRLEMAFFLMDQGASLDPQDKDGNTALTHAVIGKHVLIAQRLIQLGADITIENKNADKPLDIALKSNVPELVALFEQPLKDLLARIPSADGGQRMQGRQPPVQPADPFGDTMLTWAAREGQDNVVRAMVQSGADLHQTNRAGQTAHEVALQSGHSDIAAMLAEAEHHPRLRPQEGDKAEFPLISPH
ncbi:MAG TPA: ankyrin repeat domain-containing protein [Alphaproteobacteria bacterium]|nr:ankyrin repeat domain-containing protein [Alphaproteobacteria bacterium]